MNAPDASTALHQATLSIFVEAIMRYFDRVACIPAEIGTPFLLEGEAELLDVTSVIGVTGDLQGCVFFTAPRGLLDQLLGHVAEYQPTDELRCDICGEVANTFTGNVRKQLGPGFMISVPVVFAGQPEHLLWPKNTARYVIPIVWEGMRSLLIVCLGNAPAALGAV